MNNKPIISLTIGILSICLANVSCTKCENCTYLVETGTNTIEEPLGEYCGDEIRALEKREYTDLRGEARTECE